MDQTARTLEIRPDHQGAMLCLKRTDLSHARMRWYRKRFSELWELSSIVSASFEGEGASILWRDPFYGGLLETTPTAFITPQDISSPVTLFVRRAHIPAAPGLFKLELHTQNGYRWSATDLQDEACVFTELAGDPLQLGSALLALVQRLRGHESSA